MTFVPVNSRLALQDFNPFTTWQPYSEIQHFNTAWFEDMPEKMRDTMIQHIEPPDTSCIQDTKTEKIYENIDDHAIRIEAFGYLIKTPIWQTLMSVVNIAVRLFRIITLYHFRSHIPSPFKKTMLDLINIPLTPIGLAAMEIAAFFAMVNPKGGMKVYSSIEKLVFDKIPLPILRPKFSPIDELTNSRYVRNAEERSSQKAGDPNEIELSAFI